MYKKLLEMAKEMNKMVKVTNKGVKIALREVDLSGDEILDMVEMYDKWTDIPESEVIIAGTYLRYYDKVYEVRKTHAKQSTWNPKDTPSEFLEVKPGGMIPEWYHRDTEGWEKGSIVTFEGKTYESTHDGKNVWKPGEFAGWEIVED